MQPKLLLFVSFILTSLQLSAADIRETSTVVPPVVDRELRGVWVASVANIDWPSKPEASVEEQKTELIEILDRSQKLNLNCVILQVRPACDALYKSSLEPWSEYLTGQMGKAPDPAYDPLAFAIRESRSRGMELHAWVNPYRARHPSAKSPISADHISKRHPELVVEYGKHLWLDPGMRAVREYSLNVILEIINNYDVDGIHMDDYFYPYREKNEKGELIEFPDDKSFAEYTAGGGTLNREDWRRDNVNKFIERCYKAIKTMKPHVKFGVSPFGIWQPGHPPEIQGLNSFAELYCDSLKWWTNGWCDYISPQLYWKIEAKAQSYPVLLKWWADQNTQERHLWPGNFTSRITATPPADDKQWLPEEIINQIKATRADEGASGNIHFSMKVFMDNRAGVNEELVTEVYTKPALTPAFPWLSKGTPQKPKVTFKSETNSLRLDVKKGGTEKVSQWVVQKRIDGEWTTEILPVEKRVRVWKGTESIPDAVAVTAVNRTGVISKPAVFEVSR